ncbi:MAG TPA: sulfite exporter TauE/SafE family protein [Acidothermaceae bacterium]
MTLLQAVLLVLAGIGSGLAGSIAGLASLVSYPALLAVGLTPVAANVTNTMALVFNTAGTMAGSRPELRGQRPRIRELGAIAVAGGLVGGAILLLTPAGSFERVVPWLIGLGSLTILVPRRPTLHLEEAPAPASRVLFAGIFLIGVYAGYFGAAAGVLMLALLLITTPDTLARCNALKNVVLGISNVVAAVIFAIFGPVHWLVALPLAAGVLVGGRIGPVIVRRSPTRVLRVLIALAGLGLAIHLGLDAYR